MIDDSNETPAGTGGKAVLQQYEADAKAIREKTARLRELRMAREAANPSAAAAPSKRSAVKKTPRKGGNKAQPLSDWLATQEKEGRRN